MARCYLLVLVLLPVSAAAQPPDANRPLLDGHRLYELCRYADPAVPAWGSGRYLAAECQGYISGVLDASQRFGSVHPCLPDWLGPAQLAEIVNRYLASHPEQLHRAAAALVLEAVAESYGTLRCP